MKMKSLTLLLAVALILMAGAASAQDNPIGKADTVTLVIDQVAEAKWKITANVWNDEEIAAIDIPLKYSAGVIPLQIDSVSFADTRIDYFAQKYFQVDTTGQTMHLGGLAYMGSDKPPLAPGSGTVGYIFISPMSDKIPSTIAVDTCFFAPNNKLMLVDRDAKTIVPVVKIINNSSE